MKTFDEILEEQFKKLYPYKPLTAPEKSAIILTNIEWLTQQLKMQPTDNSVSHSNERQRIKTIRSLLKKLEDKKQ